VKAKVVRGYVDKMITLAKDGSLHARRQVRHHGSSNSSSGCIQQQLAPAAAAAAGLWGCASLRGAAVGPSRKQLAGLYVWQSTCAEQTAARQQQQQWD
jgi:hypothetical protein